jgi:hypothetical protein
MGITTNIIIITIITIITTITNITVIDGLVSFIFPADHSH